jgi:TPR repeat protein
MLAEREEFTEAEIYLRQAAEACERNAARYLAELLMRQNSHEALIWWRRAAEEGDIEAQQIFSQHKDLDGDDWSKMEVRRRHNRPHCKPPS